MYSEVTVIVDGAQEEDETFTDYLLQEEFITKIGMDAVDHGYHTEVFVINHEHDMTDEECSCVQMLTDHSPYQEWNKPDNEDEPDITPHSDTCDEKDCPICYVASLASV